MSTGNHPVAGAHSEHHFAHHFDSAEHEYDTAKQGVWLFMCTEILMFGGLFVAYAIFHHLYPEVFKVGSRFTDWRMGASNTVVLLTSSLTMALGIHYCQTNKKDKAVVMMGITILCGFMFMAIKYMEYSHKLHMGLAPGAWYHINEHGLEELKHMGITEIPSNLALYFSFYFMMTGLHGVHVIIGMALILWVMIRAAKGEFSDKYYTPVEGVGLFWHLVDLVWIYLFPLLYLVT